MTMVRINNEAELWTHVSKEALHNLFDNCFGSADFDPECGGEDLTPDEVVHIFSFYANKGILFLQIDDATQKVIGFSAAAPLLKELDVCEAVKPYLPDYAAYWYYAELGVDSRYRRRGIGEALSVATLTVMPTDRVVMRARADNKKTILLHEKMGYRLLTDVAGNRVTQWVSLKRKSGETKADERIFLVLQK
jgi:ribosomal protein S18 acetylase RimI-like enzyme